MKNSIRRISFLLILVLSIAQTQAQLTVTAQLRTRTEFRDGQGAPLQEGVDPAFFTSQRTRLGLGFQAYRLKMGLTVQDVRVWGQDVSTINRTTTQDNNGFMVHEAWAEVLLTDTNSQKGELALKIGRQELHYDDQRLIGNLDWLQQARRHDALLLKYHHGNWWIHTGFAYNQNKETSNGTGYILTPAGGYPGNTNGGSMYKSFQYMHANKVYAGGRLSVLFFSDQFSKYRTEINNGSSVKVWEKGVWTRMTTGFYAEKKAGNANLTAAGYFQFGKNAKGQDLSAWLLSMEYFQQVRNQWKLGLGLDYTTGGSSEGRSNAFDPLYGTPHKFWGLMDYFYAGSGFGEKGLIDYSIRSRHKVGEKGELLLDLHQFSSASSVMDVNGRGLSRNFGTELDLVGKYSLTRMIGMELGYSHFLAGKSLTSEGVKNIPGAQRHNNWLYLMLNIRPEFIFGVKEK